MNEGWKCPECGKIYAPYIDECEKCNDTGKADEERSSTIPNIEELNLISDNSHPCTNCPNYKPGELMACDCTIPHRRTVSYSTSNYIAKEANRVANMLLRDSESISHNIAEIVQENFWDLM